MEFLFWLEQTSLAMWISQSDSMLAFPGILLFHTIGLTLLVGTWSRHATAYWVFGTLKTWPAGAYLEA